MLVKISPNCIISRMQKSYAAFKVVQVVKASTSLLKELNSGDPDLSGAFSKFGKDGKMKKEDSKRMDDAGTTDVTENKDAASKPVSPKVRRLRQFSEKLPGKQSAFKVVQVVKASTSLLKELNSGDPDLSGAFSKFGKDVKTKKEDSKRTDDAGTTDDTENKNAASKPVSPKVRRLRQFSEKLPSKESAFKVVKVVKASTTLVKELKSGDPDISGAFSKFAKDVKTKKEGDLEQNKQPKPEIEFSHSSRRNSAEAEEGEKEGSGKKKGCSISRIITILASLISYGTIGVLYYFNIRGKLDLLRSDLTSCKDIRYFPSIEEIRSGIYSLKDSDGASYQTYCDMTTDGGGWTLVASVHDNNPTATGRCTTGDRWSSDQGNNYPRGGAAWSNTITLGKVASATNDDYKNSGYSGIIAEDVMIWQVPNDVDVRMWQQSAHLRYYTRDGFLKLYGGNLFQLFRDHYKLTGSYAFPEDNGPSPEVHVDYGNSSLLVSQLGKSVQNKVEPFYIQFRVVDSSGNLFALCPGVQVNNLSHPQHACIGSTGMNSNANYCGDFASLCWNDAQNATDVWGAEKTLYESTFLIFYR